MRGDRGGGVRKKDTGMDLIGKAKHWDR